MWLSHNNLFYVPQGLPKNLETLYLDNNQVFEIQSHLFLNHSKLRLLSFEMNKIQRVHAESFRGLQSIQQINLQFNEISMIPAGTFTDLSALTTLQMSHNTLTSVDHGAFPPQLNSLSMANIASPTVHVSEEFVSALSSIRTLNLMNSPGLVSSMLTALVKSRTRFEHVTTLNIQYNEIQSLPEALKEALGSVEHLLLDGNPFHCDQSLIWLKQWMLEGRVTFHSTDEPECATPLQLRGRKIKELQNRYFVKVVPKKSVERSQNPETPAVQVSRLALKANIVTPEETSQQRGGNPVIETSRNTDTRQAIHRLQEPALSVPSRSNTNPTARTKTERAKKRGRKRKGKKNRKNKNRKNKKGKRKRRNRGKRHNRRALRRRKCTPQTDGTIECCRVLKDGTQRCRRKRPKTRSKVTPANTRS